MVELPGSESNEQTVVTDGYFEREVRLSAADTAWFYRKSRTSEYHMSW